MSASHPLFTTSYFKRQMFTHTFLGFILSLILLLLLFSLFNSPASDKQQCSRLITAIHDEVAKDSPINDFSIKSANNEKWSYKPGFRGNDYATIYGFTQNFTTDSFKKDTTFEFCARYKGALTHFDGRFYCCGGTSAYHFDDSGHDIKSEKNFLPCFSRSSTSVEAEKNRIEFSSKRNSSLEPAGWGVLYGDNMVVHENLMYESGRHSSSEMTRMPINESDALTAERLAGTGLKLCLVLASKCCRPA